MRTTTLIATVVPLGRRGHYSVYLGDGILLSASRTPLHDAARELIRLGADSDDILVMRRTGTSHDAMRGRLAHAAGLIIDEDRCRFRPVRGGDTAPPVRQTPLACAGGHASADGRTA